MARPQKEGIDYFSLDVDMDQDDKVILLEARHGIQGFGVLVKLLMKIYKEGYFYKWTEREQLLFSSRINVDINLVIAVVNDALKWEMFDNNLFEQYQILTSKGIQKRYLEAVRRRTELTLIAEYLLISPEGLGENLKTTINLVNVNKNPVNANKNESQEGLIPEEIPKEKKSKVNETKGKETKELFGEKVLLTSEEFQKLVNEYGLQNTNEMIAILDNWYLTKGNKPNKSDYHTMVGKGWVLRKFQEDKARGQKNGYSPEPRVPKAFASLQRLLQEGEV